MYRRMHTVADNKMYKENMQDRTRMARNRAGSTGQLWYVLQMGCMWREHVRTGFTRRVQTGHTG